MLENWEGAYRAAMLETDPGKLIGKIDSATAVLRTRLLELSSSPTESGETERIADALRTLDLIRRVELQIPEEAQSSSEEANVSGFHHRFFPGHRTR
jgi:hypothetical protein